MTVWLKKKKDRCSFNVYVHSETEHSLIIHVAKLYQTGFPVIIHFRQRSKCILPPPLKKKKKKPTRNILRHTRIKG